MKFPNRTRPLVDQEVPSSLVPGQWYPATVDDPETWPQVGEYGHGCLHCTLAVPANDWIESGEFEAASPVHRFTFCRPWSGQSSDFPTGHKVWVMEFGGFNLVMLAEC